MDCPSCQTRFNAVEHQPHIISQCGHSICQKCLRILLAGCGVCPTCKKVQLTETVEAYPPNFSLLAALQLNSNNNEALEDFFDQITEIAPCHDLMTPLDITAAAPEHLCPQHMKPF